MKALIITWEGYQDHEVIYPYYRCREETPNVSIMANKEVIFGIMGTKMNADLNVSDLSVRYDEIFNKYDSCCFSGEFYKTYENEIKETVSQLKKGYFEIYLDETHKTHKISELALKIMIKHMSN